MTLPELHLSDWRPTKDTLHLYCQIVGKVRLATTSPRNHWWNAPLYVDVRGLTTRRLHHKDTTFKIDFDFVDHRSNVHTADGRSRNLRTRRRRSGRRVRRSPPRGAAASSESTSTIKEQPFGVPMTTPFPEDRSTRPGIATRSSAIARILDWSDDVFEEFSGWFSGKTSPVHLFWHSFDLAVTRFSGRRSAADSRPTPSRRRRTRRRSSRSASGPATTTSPTPPTTPTRRPNRTAFATSRCPPASGSSSPHGSLAILPYESVRTARDPRGTLLAFLQGAYEAGARLAGWGTSGFESSWCPTPKQLHELQATAAHEFGRPAYAGRRR